MTRHVVLGVLGGEVELLLGVNVHARHEIEDVQDRVVDVHGESLRMQIPFANEEDTRESPRRHHACVYRRLRRLVLMSRGFSRVGLERRMC